MTFLRGEVDQALEAWTAAERISDRLGRADFMIEPLRAAALVLTDRLGEAKALLAQAPERCSGAARPQIGRAIVAAAEGDLDEAERIVVELQASGTMTDRLAARVVREGLRQLNAQSKP